MLAPVEWGLVNGQNYYTAITRAAYGVNLWTEDVAAGSQARRPIGREDLFP